MHLNGSDCEFMQHRDIRSAPGDWPVSGGGYLNGSGGTRGNALRCQGLCNVSADCGAWIFLNRPSTFSGRVDKTPGAGDCEFRPHNHGCSRADPHADIYAGVKLSALKNDGVCGTRNGATAGVVGTVQLLPTDKELDIRLFWDHDFVEIFFQQGRAVLSVGAKQANVRAVENGGFGVYTTDAAVMINSAKAWSVGSIWVSKAAVLAQHEASLHGEAA